MKYFCIFYIYFYEMVVVMISKGKEGKRKVEWNNLQQNIRWVELLTVSLL